MNYFMLNLDTTGPDIAIEAPDSALIDSIIEVKITANEILDITQNFYVMDSTGTRFPVILDYHLDFFHGRISLHGFKKGFAMIYAEVLDTVHNKSVTISKAIDVGDKLRGKAKFMVVPKYQEILVDIRQQDGLVFTKLGECLVDQSTEEMKVSQKLQEITCIPGR